MRSALAVAGLLILGFAPSANAVPVEVTYAVTSTATIPSFGNAHFATMNGFATVRYQNATALGSLIVDGAAELQSFNAAGVVSFVVGGPATLFVTGNIGLTLGPIAGTALNQATNQQLNASSHVNLHFAGTANAYGIHCNGALCGTVGLVQSLFPQGFQLAFDTNAVNLNTGLAGNYLGNANLNASGAPGTAGNMLSNQGSFGQFGGMSVQIQNVLTEISRTVVVPEPTTGSLVWLGVAVGIASTRWHRRIRRG